MNDNDNDGAVNVFEFDDGDGDGEHACSLMDPSKSGGVWLQTRSPTRTWPLAWNGKIPRHVCT